jgi:FtsP/CotA-like multicopper oxidase with cupredoxin domain
LEVVGRGRPDFSVSDGPTIRVREGELILFRLLNASGNMGISLALPGHRFQLLALDGNPVPTRALVDILKLDVAERTDVIVEMNNPGVWVSDRPTTKTAIWGWE